MGDIQPQDVRQGDGSQPFVDIPLERFRIFTGCDVDSVSSSQSLADGAGVCTEGDDQVRRGEQTAGQVVEAAAQVEFRVTEPAAGMEEARESVKVQIQTTVHQGGFVARAELVFLFGAEEQVVHLVGERVFRILLEERLKWTFLVLFAGEGKIVTPAQGLRERGLADAARADDDDKLVHGSCIVIRLFSLQI